MRGDGKPGRGGDEQEHGLRRLAQLKAAIVKVQGEYPHPAVVAAMKALKRELKL